MPRPHHPDNDRPIHADAHESRPGIESNLVTALLASLALAAAVIVIQFVIWLGS